MAKLNAQVNEPLYTLDHILHYIDTTKLYSSYQGVLSANLQGVVKKNSGGKPPVAPIISFPTILTV